MRLILLLLVSASFNLAYADEFYAKVIAVMDGDTVMVLRDGKKIKVRLAYIDAPESAQVFGKESRQALVDRVLKKQVRINSKAVDSYGRMIAEISIDGQSVNEEQVREGMAWGDSNFYPNKHYVELNKQAKQSRRGLWAQSAQPISPQQWRKSHPSITNPSKAVNPACGKKYLCSKMKTCEEAKIYFLHCGVKSLDGDGDGVPCESLCVTD